jgi:outer membrane protein assembly factor BamB
MTNILQDKDGDVHGRVYALDVQTGALRWEFKLDSQVGKLLAADGRVFFGATDGTMRCLSLDAGEVLWSASTEGEMLHAPATDGKRIYAVATLREKGSVLGGVFAFDVATGWIEWRLKTDAAGSTTPWIEGGVMFAGFGQRLCAIDALRGVLQWQYHAGFPIGDAKSNQFCDTRARIARVRVPVTRRQRRIRA